MRIGVLGAGWFASRRHMPDIERMQDLEMAAICRRDPVALATLAERFAPGRRHTDWREMLDAGGLDAVLIATPNSQHYEQAMAALEMGLHVLLEKPMTLTADEALGLRDEAARRGLVLTVALNPPHWAHCHRVREAIASGDIGQVEGASLFWAGNSEYAFGKAPRPTDLPGLVPPTMYRSDPALCGGGCFIDGGSHLVSTLLWTTGLRAVSVSAAMDALPSDERASIAIMLEGNVPATITSVANSQSGARRVRNSISTSAGSVTVDGFNFDTRIQGPAGRDERFSEAELTPVRSPVADFAAAILRGETPASGADHGAHVVQVVEAAYRSAASGETIRIG